MAPRTSLATMLATAGAVVVLLGPAHAQSGSTGRPPAQADFDLCNREAHAAIGGSASPRTSATPSPGPSTGGTTIGSGTLGAAGATGGTGALSDGSTLTGSSTTGDPTLRGIASGAGSDPAYQQAYRECLRRRGF
jgi:hypothetical protein